MLTCKEIDEAIAYFAQMLTPEEHTLQEIAHEVLTPEAYETYESIVMAGLAADQAYTHTALRVARLVVEQLMEEDP